MTEIFKVKNGLSPELMNDVFEFIEKQYSLQTTSHVFDRIAWTFHKSGAIQAVALNISKAFDSVWHADLLYKISLLELMIRYLALFPLSSIDCFDWFWMVSLRKNTQLMLVFLKAPFLVLHFSYYTSMTFLMLLAISLSTLMILLSTLSVIRHLIFGNRLVSELEYAEWDKKWLLDFNAGKTQLFSFDWSNNFGTIDVKINGSALEEKMIF